MSARERLVEKAAMYLFEADDYCEASDPYEGITETDQMRYVLDRIIPQVTTPAELDALPVNSKLLDDDGHVYGIHEDLSPSLNADYRAALVNALPLTLVYRPAA